IIRAGRAATNLWEARRGSRRGRERGPKGGQRSGGHRDVLLAIAPAHPDAPHHLLVYLDGEAADEDGELSGMHGMDAEGLVARQRGPGGRLVEAVRGAPVGGGRGSLGGGGARKRCVGRGWAAAVKALAIAISTPVSRAPVIRCSAIGWPPSSQTQMVSGTLLSWALASAA